jgi:small GTP-binding protein
MFYTSPTTGEDYIINLLDTPGHADFSSELLRSLLPSQGALLLVDAAQGIQAQTLSVLEEARKRGLKVIGAVNKWDLVQGDGRGEAAVRELSELLDCPEEEILRISAKTGMGVESVLEGIVKLIPPPSPHVEGEKLRALVFDSWYDSFRGVVSLMAVAEGEIRKGKSRSRGVLNAADSREQGILSLRRLPNSRTRSSISASSRLRRSVLPIIPSKHLECCARVWLDGSSAE